MATDVKMVTSQELSKKLADNALETIGKRLELASKAKTLPTAKSAEMMKDNEAIFESEVNKDIDKLIAAGLSEEKAATIVEKAYMQILDELDEEKD